MPSYSRSLSNESGAEELRQRALSRRRVRETLQIGQVWVELADGTRWTVRQLHRKDGMVALEGPGAQPRFVGFGALGSLYRLVES